MTEQAALWRLPLPVPAERLPSLRDYLSEEERVRADRFHFAPDRDNWTATRAGLRVVLAQRLRCAPSDVHFAAGPHGKPRLTSDSDHARLRFNISHTHGLALLAVTDGEEVGVDVEQIRTDFDPLTLPVFAPDEILLLQNAPLESRHALFFTLWTAKEALLKAHGAGLHLPPDTVSVAGMAEDGMAHALGLRVVSLPVGVGFAAALALPEKTFHCFCLTWHDLCI